MAFYQLHTTQKLPVTIEEAWKFLSDPKNLKVITPPHMGFKILSGAEKSMYAGQIIQYIVQPFLGLKTKWVTEITHVKNNHYFVDEQRFGPYKLWHHKHFLKPIKGGVEMEDIIDYKLPYGIFGKIMHTLFIKNKLKKIFEFREKKLIEIFGKYV
ncbi:SRPBCC family protein [Abyssalbus ytuae]|uniref:SRPBCC family protein n=1 Tax=Abyssalbus ytuae TaxID=2926907 RepID=A0A9E7CTB6_9FLAO|nr:SRPBCC family protein [Abyssalbus ytuae]UOB17831.1 SRPBCC family protein [Abyssalbus ytuae]